MKTISVVLLWLVLMPGLAFTQTPAPMALADRMKAAGWKKRILLLCAPSREQPDYQKQRTWLADDTTGTQERDLEIISVLYNQASEADREFLRKKYQLSIPSSEFTLLLIGKDGGAKMKRTTPVPPDELYRTIDAMPMRKREKH